MTLVHIAYFQRIQEYKTLKTVSNCDKLFFSCRIILCHSFAHKLIKASAHAGSELSIALIGAKGWMTIEDIDELL